MPGHQDQVGKAIDIVCTVGVLCNPERIIDARVLRGCVEPRCFSDILRRHTRNLLGFFRRVTLHGFYNSVKTKSVFINKVLINQIFFNDDMSHRI